jgi:hypothetical protein
MGRTPVEGLGGKRGSGPPRLARAPKKRMAGPIRYPLPALAITTPNGPGQSPALPPRCVPGGAGVTPHVFVVR